MIELLGSLVGFIFVVFHAVDYYFTNEKIDEIGFGIITVVASILAIGFHWYAVSAYAVVRGVIFYYKTIHLPKDTE